MSELARKILRASLVVIFFHLLWKFSGLIAAMVLSNYKRGPLTDAYYTAHDMIIFSLFLIGKDIFGPAFLPVFMRLKDEKGEKSAWEFASTILSTLGLLALILVPIVAIFAPELATLVAPKYSAETLALCATMARYMSIALFPLAIASLTYFLLNSYRQFGLPAAADGLYRVSFALVVGAGFLGWRHGWIREENLPLLLSLGVILGAVAKCTLHLIGLGKERLLLYRPRLDFKTPAMKQFLWLAAPLVVGIALSRFRDFSENGASSAEEGLYTALSSAKKIIQAQVAAIPFALGVVMFPYLCTLAARKDHKEFGRLIFYSMHFLALFILPITAILCALKTPMIQAFFQRRGVWDDNDVWVTATILGFFSLGFLFFAMEEIIKQSYFSVEDTVTPVALGLLMTGLNILFFQYGEAWFGLPPLLVVALGFPFFRAIKNVLLLLLFKRKIPLTAEDRDPWFAAKLIPIVAGTGLAALGGLQLMDCWLPFAELPQIAARYDRLSGTVFETLKALRLVLPALVALGLMFLLMALFRVKEFGMLRRFIQTRGWKQKKEPAPDADHG